ncbi:MAG: hypothetical protein ACRDX8_00310 [Acidimicrobiales bacterium]
MIVVMTLSMGASGMSYAMPLNLGMAPFDSTITPPKTMLPLLMRLMGMHVSEVMMPSAIALLRGPHPSPAMM